MQTAVARWVGILFVALSLQSASADSTQVTTPNATPDHVAIQGYDVVAYFTDGKAMKGDPSYEMPFDDVKWQFANASHKQMFAADPDRYLPQYGGMCAGGMAMGVSVPANPDNWVIVDGKLYMVSGGAADLADWKAHAAENIKAADKIWSKNAYK
jgi:hypothetical protein